MKYRIILDCTADFLATMGICAPAAKGFLDYALTQCTVDRMSIEDVTPVEGDLIPADECHCLDGAGERS